MVSVQTVHVCGKCGNTFSIKKGAEMCCKEVDVNIIECQDCHRPMTEDLKGQVLCMDCAFNRKG